MTSVARLLVAMRKDVGYRFTRFTAKDLAALQLDFKDQEVAKVLKHL